MEFRFAYLGVTLVYFLLFFVEVRASKKLIVVLVDGVRWDYINDKNLKGFRRIIENGVKAPYAVPVFPSLSYPNWQTLVTGLYPENHGFVGNRIYDNATDSFFEMIPSPGAANPRWWNDAEPVWITAEKNRRRTALYWWAGCEVEIKGSHPTICERQIYDGPPIKEVNVDFQERIDDFVQMFKPSKKFLADRLSLVLMYYSSVDYAGHKFGPNSPEVKKAIEDIDDILDKMQKKIQDAGLEDEVNLMVISDHGMANVKENVVKHIDLKKYAAKIKYQMDFGGVSMIIPEPGLLNKLVQEIAADKIEGLLLYKKDDIPEKYHIKGSSKTAPLVLIAKKGYCIDQLIDPQKIPTAAIAMSGHHGYDPEEVEDMRTIFLATGPDFRKGFETEVLHNTDHYNVMCRILDIPALPNNGSWERVQSMLVKEEKHPPTTVAMASAAVLTRSNHYFISVMFITVCASMISLITSRLL